MHNALILHYEPVAGQTVPAEALSTQLALLQKLKMPVVSLEQLVENNYQRRRWHRHVVALSCSGTFLAKNPTVFQTFQASGFPLTVFLAASEFSNETQQKIWQEIVAAGFSIGLHSVSEVVLSTLPEEMMQQKLAERKAILEAETGRSVRFFLASSGNYSPQIIAAAKAVGFEALLTQKLGYNRFNADLFCLKTWTVPPQTSLKVFEKMLCRDKKELLVQELKTQALRSGSRLQPVNLFGKLRGLFRRERV